ncbi:hypothetical protein GGR55DRAFT_680345 [Xylaria sp. FL0064]|nr:hypothetical protein GGR55DRAFT_680345 [Xylaria sp. FL0064]
MEPSLNGLWPGLDDIRLAEDDDVEDVIAPVYADAQKQAMSAHEGQYWNMVDATIEHGNPWFCSSSSSSSFSGSLVCPVVPGLSPRGLSGDTHFGDINTVFPGDIHAHEANQAPTQWYDSTGVFESLLSMPQGPIDPISYLDQSNLANDTENSLTHDHYHPFCLQASEVMVNPPSHPEVAGSTLMATFDSAPIELINTASGVPLQTQLTHDGTSVYGRDYTLGASMASGATSSIAPLVKEASFNPLSRRTQREVLRNDPAGTRTSECSEIEPSRSPSSSELGIELRDKSRARKTKVVKVYACVYDACPFTASSRKDVQRHLQSEKHRNDSIHMHQDKFYCEVPGCTYKLAEEGCSRRDNMLRHMSKVHEIELDREKRGRKRRREE